MPHAVYLAAMIACPWAGCTFQIEIVDFQLERYGDAALYAAVMQMWAQSPGCGLVARCPGCGGYVIFGPDDKQTATDPQATTLPVLPDDWHRRAYIA